MRYYQLFEHDVKGARVTKNYPELYHITDYSGFSYSIANNSLKAFRYPYISTTYDPQMNSVGGRSHYEFKFILDGNKCLNDFTAYYYKSFADYADGSGKHWYDEKEIGLQTKEISPLQDYVKGLIILRKIYSRSFIQWMFYPITERTNFMGGLEHSAAPKGIESLFKFYNDWKKPIYVLENSNPRELNKKEKQFINACFKLIKGKVTFDKALKILVNEFPEEIEGHWKERLSPESIAIEKVIPKYIELINNAIAEKDIRKINLNKVKTIARNIFTKLGYEKHLEHIMRALEQNSFFHPIVEPSDWAIVLKNIITNRSVNAIIDNIGWVGKEKILHKLEYYDPNSRFGSRQHYKAYAG